MIMTVCSFFFSLEQFERAVEDLENASKLALSIYEPQDRRIAEAYFKCGCALGYANRRNEAKEYLNQAIQILRSRLAKLEKEDNDQARQELMDIRDLIPDIVSKVLRDSTSLVMFHEVPKSDFRYFRSMIFLTLRVSISRRTRNQFRFRVHPPKLH